MRARKLLMLAAAINLAASAEAQDWTRFRGPNGQGQSDAPTIPITWTENDYNWKVELPGIGHSSPVVWGDKVFVTSADPDSATLVKTLRQFWTLPGQDKPGASATPDMNK